MRSLDSVKGTDIYLLDQFLKGRFLPEQKILDAGCGRGRNMTWLAQNKFDVHGCDIHPEILKAAQQLTGLPKERFKVCPLEKLDYPEAIFDHVICNAVLHFASSTAHFMEMIGEMHRVLKPGGTLFVRMTATFGLPKNYTALGGGRFLLQDGTERFLLTKELLTEIKRVGFEQLEPVRSVLVEELRSMTTLVLIKT